MATPQISVTCSGIRSSFTTLSSPVYVKVTNHGSAALPKSAVIMKENTFFWMASAALGEIQPHESEQIVLRPEIKGGASPYTIAPKWEIVVHGQTWNFFPYASNYIDELIQMGKPADAETFNLYLVGLPGCGKSSFINTLLTLKEPEAHLVQQAPVGMGGAHTTTNLVRYQLLQNVSLWDTWGMNAGNMKPEVLRAYKKGNLPNNFSMKDNDLVDWQAPEKRKAHNVIFVIPQAAVSNPNEMETFKAIWKEFKDLCPVIIITFGDQIEKNFRTDPGSNFQNLDNLRQQVADIIGAPLYNIFYVLNYKDETKRNFELERLAYKALHRAMLNCKSNGASVNANAGGQQEVNRLLYSDF